MVGDEVQDKSGRACKPQSEAWVLADGPWKPTMVQFRTGAGQSVKLLSGGQVWKQETSQEVVEEQATL